MGDVELTHDCGLLCVDMQKDFFDGGADPIPGAEEIMEQINEYTQVTFKMQGLPVFLTRHWHPTDHGSFRDNGGSRPEHCVQDTEGAEFHPDFRHPGACPVISKGTEPDLGCGSGFEGTKMAKDVREMNIETLFVTGVETERAVKETVVEAIDEGFDVYVLTDAIASRDESAAKKALSEMQEAGAELVTEDDLA